MTLTELAIVGTLAVLVMLALTGFYYNSQKVWAEASTQAMAQRDATLIVDVLGRRVRAGSEAVVTDVDGPLHHRVEVFEPGPGGVPESIGSIGWSSDDHRVHDYAADGSDRGPIADSRVLQFRFTTLDTTLVELTCLELLSAEGDTVRTASRFALLNR
jgi:hypothetical protein